MALTVTRLAVYRGQGQADEFCFKLVTGAADYITGGYVITPVLLGLTAFETDSGGTGLPPVADYYSIDGDGVGSAFAVINPANGNLQMFVTTTGVEVGNAGTPAWTGFIRCYGR
jgi:hypothetical protein